LKLEEVFGEVPNPPMPELDVFYTDMTCQLGPHLARVDKEAFDLVKLKLGEVHKVKVCIF
jgi:hypothetical protein